ncbi:alpha/beta fold hydrolase [Nocardia amamiensis]|uniref:alpha/beta fold hydrolase n=1 Tax=Nocardia amamiensis TaxID=404578 RepID=UPI002B4B0DE6|nr:alpha/beta fold hydrolase [Nocardia amamiensis]
MQALSIHEHGAGPAVVLVHGGAGPKTTWSGLHSLSARWTLLLVHRRGFGASPPPPGGRQDFEIDADDLEGIFRDRRPHVVAHSYGVLGVLLAAARQPWTVRSLTLIEPPLYFLAPEDPEVARLESLGNTVLTHGLDTDPAILREFLTLAGSPDGGGSRLSDPAVRRAWGARLPGQARPNLTVMRAAGIPALVASGGHTPGLERICDLLADALGAQRLVTPGAGHFVPAAPGFADRLEEFLLSGTGTESRGAQGADPD